MQVGLPSLDDIFDVGVEIFIHFVIFQVPNADSPITAWGSPSASAPGQEAVAEEFEQLIMSDRPSEMQSISKLAAQLKKPPAAARKLSVGCAPKQGGKGAAPISAYKAPKAAAGAGKPAAKAEAAAKPAWSDAVVMPPPAKKPLKELRAIRRPSVSSPGGSFKEQASRAGSSPLGSFKERALQPAKAAAAKASIPPLNLASQAEPQQAHMVHIESSSEYITTGIGKPMSPMLRSASSAVSQDLSDSARALPQLSRTGGLTPRSAVPGSNRLGSQQSLSGSPQNSLSHTRLSHTGGHVSTLRRGEQSHDVAKPVIAFGKIIPPKRVPLVATQSESAALSASASHNEAASPLSAATHSLKSPEAGVHGREGYSEDVEVDSTPSTSRLGRRRSSTAGSRRASMEGSALQLSARQLSARQLSGRQLSARQLSARQLSARQLSAWQGDAAPEAQDVIGLGRRASRDGTIRQQAPSQRGTRNTFSPRDSSTDDDHSSAGKQKLGSMHTGKTAAIHITAIGQQSEISAAPYDSYAESSSADDEGPTKRKRAAGGEAGASVTEKASFIGSEKAEASGELPTRQVVVTPRIPQSPRSGSRLGMPREHGSSLQRGVSAPMDSLTLRRSGSGAALSATVTRDGWIQESSILAPSTSDATAQSHQLPRRKSALKDTTPRSGLLPKQNSVPISFRAPSSIAARKEFLSRPGPTTAPIQCTIVRDTGVSKSYPSYSLYLDDPAELILAARKRKKSKTSNYILSLDNEDLLRGTYGYCGKVRSNFVGTQFSLFDGGAKPDKATPGVKVRSELGLVRYQYNVLGTRGPRKMTVIIPRLDAHGAVPFIAESDGSMTVRLKQQEGLDALLVLKNKAPKWNTQLGAYCLNFGGRVTHASVKNFQLVSDDNPERIILQFGKVGKDKFSMDFQSPMSALQAFEICLTSFDGKLACE